MIHATEEDVRAAEADIESGAPDELPVRHFVNLRSTPLAPLWFGMIEPDAETLLYGGGGLGKGMTCSWMLLECWKAGRRVLVYDAERREYEWRRRSDGLGIPPEFHCYVAPPELPRELLGQPLHVVVPYLGQLADREGCVLILIDSILAAANLGEEGLKADTSEPYRICAARAATGKTLALIGHPPKYAAGGEPYGSVAWGNAMRLTWVGARAEGNGHRVLWTPRKRNERGLITPLRLTFLYDEIDRPREVEVEDARSTIQDWITAQLVAFASATIEDLAEQMMVEGSEDEPREADMERTRARIRSALWRMKRSGRVHRIGQRKPYHWSLGERG